LTHSTSNTGCCTRHSAMMLTKHRVLYTPLRHEANQTQGAVHDTPPWR
jgi:hypothetical protein